MKRALLKPQKRVVSAVLAYSGECDAEYRYEGGAYVAYWACDAECIGFGCYYEAGAGECTMWERHGRYGVTRGCVS